MGQLPEPPHHAVVVNPLVLVQLRAHPSTPLQADIQHYSDMVCFNESLRQVNNEKVRLSGIGKPGRRATHTWPQ